MAITYLIIGFTVLISFFAFNNATAISRMIMNPYLVNTRGEYYRFLTSGFIHKDHMHLLFNMFSFYFFGLNVENEFKHVFHGFGSVYFILLYIIAIVVSDLPTYFKQRHNPGYNSLGASGGVAAVIFASIILHPLDNICIYFFCAPGFILGTLYLVFSFYMGRKSNDNINHDAHLYGALFGLLFCAVLYPSSIPRCIEEISSWRYFN